MMDTDRKPKIGKFSLMKKINIRADDFFRTLGSKNIRGSLSFISAHQWLIILPPSPSRRLAEIPASRGVRLSQSPGAFFRRNKPLLDSDGH